MSPCGQARAERYLGKVNRMSCSLREQLGNSRTQS
jgi:hypothetical protein